MVSDGGELADGNRGLTHDSRRPINLSGRFVSESRGLSDPDCRLGGDGGGFVID